MRFWFVLFFLPLLAIAIWEGTQPPTATQERRPPWHALVKHMQFASCGQREDGTYVIAVNGLDDNPCTVTCPCRSISEVIEKMHGGETLYMRGGVYHVGKGSRLFRPTP